MLFELEAISDGLRIFTEVFVDPGQAAYGKAKESGLAQFLVRLEPITSKDDRVSWSVEEELVDRVDDDGVEINKESSAFKIVKVFTPERGFSPFTRNVLRVRDPKFW